MVYQWICGFQRVWNLKTSSSSPEPILEKRNGLQAMEELLTVKCMGDFNLKCYHVLMFPLLFQDSEITVPFGVDNEDFCHKMLHPSS